MKFTDSAKALIKSASMGQKYSLPDLGTSYQIVMLGLDNAGKTTVLYRMKADQYVTTVPTVGFNCEKIKPCSGRAKNVTFHVWDIGGQERIRPLWRSYVRHTDAIIFVVDSTDAERFEEAKLELSNLLRCSDIPSTVPVLLLANKQDLPDAISQPEVQAAVGCGSGDLGPMHPSETQGCCAITGEGLDDSFDILYDLIQKSRKVEKGKKKR